MEKKAQKFINKKKKIYDEVELWYQDEARYGQKGITTRIWHTKGIRLELPRQNGFKSSYIIGAVNPKSGQKHALLFDGMDSRVMSYFLETFSKSIKPGKHIVLIIDGASWHKSDEVEIPKNISLFTLPPVSPQLNPIERLWNYLKQNYLSRKLYDGLENIFDIGAKVWNSLSKNTIKSICATDLRC